MRAALLERFGGDLAVGEVAQPAPEPDHVLVRVRAVGLCGTDLKMRAGALARGTELPHILGHETAGEIVDPGTSELREGQRVACHSAVTCGECPACQEGRSQFCQRVRVLGIDIDGGLAEYISVPAVNAIPFSERIDFAAAAVTMDAVATTWHALHSRAAASPGEAIIIVGAGGLGLNAIQVASDMGLRVAVVEPSEARRGGALAVGADVAVAPDAANELAAWVSGGADLAFEVSGTELGFRTAFERVRVGGRVVCCGYYPGREFSFESFALVAGERTVLGSRSSSHGDAREALRAVDAGRITPPIGATFALEDVNAALDAVEAAEAPGRIVVTL